MNKPCVDCGQLSKAVRCVQCGRAYAKGRVKRSPIERGYTAEWRKISKWLREQQPWCSFCFTQQDLTVDHIVPLALGGLSELSNARVLCRSCNSARRVK